MSDVYTSVELRVVSQGRHELTVEDVEARWDRDIMEYPMEDFEEYSGDSRPGMGQHTEVRGQIGETVDGVTKYRHNIVTMPCITLAVGSKYTIEGLGEFARKLTNKYRGVVAIIEENYDDGGTKTEWRSGKVVAEYEKGWVKK